jgi:geranylgeranyl diphosphate synthase, type I
MTAVAEHEPYAVPLLAPPTPGDVASARRLLPGELRRWIDMLGPELAHICAHQLCLDDDTGGGKLARPALAIGCARAAGGATVDALPAAVAVELIPNASLIHDDIMDGDECRRHRPTVWTQYGVAAAILAGDALIGLGFEALATDAPAPYAGPAAADLARAVRSLAIGQGADLRLEGSTTATTADSLALIAGKTGALFAVAGRLGARLGGAPDSWIAAFTDFGANLGVAFQLVDDLLGIWGDPAVTGKPVGSDLRARKNSAPVTAALATGGTAANRLREIYRSADPMTDAGVAEARALVERAGGRAWTVDQCRRHVRAAWDAIDPLPLGDAARDALHDVAEYIVAEHAVAGVP